MMPPGESRCVCRWDRQTDGRTDGRQSVVTLRFPLDATSIKMNTAVTDAESVRDSVHVLHVNNSLQFNEVYILAQV